MSAKQLIYAYNQPLHVRPLILTAGVCWHKHEDNAQMASFAWSRKVSKARKSCGDSAMSAFYRRGRICAVQTFISPCRKYWRADEWSRGKLWGFTQNSIGTCGFGQHSEMHILLRSTEDGYRDLGFTASLVAQRLASWPALWKGGNVGSTSAQHLNIPRLNSGVAALMPNDNRNCTAQWLDLAETSTVHLHFDHPIFLLQSVLTGPGIRDIRILLLRQP